MAATSVTGQLQQVQQNGCNRNISNDGTWIPGFVMSTSWLTYRLSDACLTQSIQCFAISLAGNLSTIKAQRGTSSMQLASLIMPPPQGCALNVNGKLKDPSEIIFYGSESDDILLGAKPAAAMPSRGM